MCGGIVRVRAWDPPDDDRTGAPAWHVRSWHFCAEHAAQAGDLAARLAGGG